MDAVISFLSTNAEFVALLVGLVTPFLTSVVEQPGWSRAGRTAAAYGVSLVVGFATAASTGQLNDAGSVLVTLALVLTAAETSYQKLFKGAARKVEQVTSRVKTDDVIDGVIDESVAQTTD